MIPIEFFQPNDQDGTPRAVVSLKRPSATGDVPERAIVGTVPMIDDGPDWASLQIAPSFLSLYSTYMRGELEPTPHTLKNAAGKPGDYIYVIDGRVRDPKGRVPFHDIIGWYRSDAVGRPIGSTFEYNKDHTMVSGDGFSSLLSEPNLRALIFG